MIIRDPHQPPGRQPALKGVLMVDTVNGQIRVRKWPRKRGKPKSPETQANNELFRVIQYAARWIAPQYALFLREYTENTPILPRDVLTAIGYNRLWNIRSPDGKALYPMPFRTDVSESLDAISQTEGDYLRRGADGWEGVDGQPDQQAAILLDQTLTTSTFAVSFPVPDWVNRLVLYALAVTTTATSQIQAQVSTNDGLSYYGTSGDYLLLGNPSSLTNAATIPMHEGTSASAKSGALFIQDPRGQYLPQIIIPTRNTMGIFQGSADRIDRIRFRANTGNMTGGRLFAAGFA